MISKHHVPEEIKKMQDAAIKQAREMQARSGKFSSAPSMASISKKEIPYRLPHGKNSAPKKQFQPLNKFQNKKPITSATDTALKSKTHDNKFNLKIPGLLETLLQSSDKTLIIVLIILLMDDEENFMIMMVLFYLLI